MSIKFKFLFYTISIIYVVVLSMTFLLHNQQKLIFRENQFISQINTVNALASVSEEALLREDDLFALRYTRLLKDTIVGLEYAIIMNMSGIVRAHSDPTKIRTAPGTEQARKALKTDELSRQVFFNNGEKITEISKPVYLEDTRIGVARIGYNEARINQVLDRFLNLATRRIYILGFAVIVFGIAAALLLTEIIVNPIKKIAYGAKKIGGGDLDVNIKLLRKDELGELAENINNMAGKLSEIDKLKDDFLSSVTHELRSPLNSIGMYLELFSKEELGEINSSQKEAIEVMKKATRRLSGFVNNILDLSKLKNGELKVKSEVFKLPVLIEDIEKLYKVQLKEKNIDFKVRYPDFREIPEVYADYNNTVRIFENLLVNAIKFTSENGTVNVKVKPTKDNYVEVGIEDTGRGIPKDKLEEVFDKFKQVKSGKGKVDEPKGTGLGLPLAKKLVELQGGNIFVESEKDQGTTFYFTLPVKKDKKDE